MMISKLKYFVLSGILLIFLMLNPNESSLATKINKFEPGKYGMNTTTRVTNMDKTNFLLFSIINVSIFSDTPNPLYIDLSSNYTDKYIGFLGNWIKLK